MAKSNLTESSNPIIKNRSLLPDVTLIAAFVTLAGLYVFLMITDRVPLTGVIFLAFLWIAYWLSSKRLSYTTPMDFPIIALLSLLPLSLIYSIDVNLTLPKVYGLVLGVVFFYWIVNYVRHEYHILMVIFALILLAIGVPLLGLIGADWSVSSYELPSRIVGALTSRFGFLARLTTGGGIHVNTIGGTLVFFIPLLVSLLLNGGAIKNGTTLIKGHKKTINILIKLLATAGLLFALAILVFTESRGSYLGCATGVLAVLVWKDRRFLWLVPVLIVGLIIALFIFANGDIYQFLQILDTTQDKNTLEMRQKYWTRTLYLIQDFPFTGAGLGTYNKVFQKLYLFTPFVNELEPSFYAHNLYLGLAASMGIPALVLYFSLVGSVAYMVISTALTSKPIVKMLLIGLASGLLAHLVYGLFDNYLPGEKLGAVMWVYFGVTTAFYIHRESFAVAEVDGRSYSYSSTGIKISQWLIIFFIGLISWIMISLIAITFINREPIISLIVAALGGVTFGLLTTRKFGLSMFTKTAVGLHF